MAIIKPSKIVLEKLEKKRRKLLAEEYKIKIFSEGIKTKFWELISKILKKKLEDTKSEIEKELNNLVNGNDRKLLVLKEREMQIVEFLGINNFIKIKDRIRNEIEKSNEEIKNYNAKLYGNR